MLLDWTKPQGTSYCIPLWLRDEQIKQSIELVKGRIKPGVRTEDPIAIACFGPSLKDTWEELRNFKVIMTCSGAHKFLVERGIVPTYHVEVDPRPHKVGLIGPPQAGTQYLIASTCHRAVFDHLKGYDVRLWHVFDGSDTGLRILPPSEPAITGGCDVGLRCFAVASLLGYRNIHVFGMDHSAGTEDAPTDRRHADEHPNGGKNFAICEYEGVKYRTTPPMLEAARTLFHELNQLPAVNPRFYGNGLAQHMAKNWKPMGPTGKPLDNVIAFENPELISPEYRDLNKRLHHDNLAYGVGGGRHAKTVIEMSERMKTRSVLDYGCGKGYLAQAIPWPIWEYDPAVPGKDASPRPADLVVCTDVLEHIEPDKLLYVLAELRRLTRLVGFFVIHTGPSKKFLADGRNAHLIQENAEWWRRHLKQFFKIGKLTQVGPELYVVVGVSDRKKLKYKLLPSAAGVKQ